jgi:hypothetical protein
MLAIPPRAGPPLDMSLKLFEKLGVPSLKNPVLVVWAKKLDAIRVNLGYNSPTTVTANSSWGSVETPPSVTVDL